jgi:hypothetical protein
MWEKFNFKRLRSIFLINIAIKETIDFVINPILMIELGYTISLAITTSFYVIIGIISVKLYDKKGEDLFGIETYKQNRIIKNYDNKLIAILMMVVNLFNMFMLGLVSSLKNTGLPVIIFREGSFLFNGFTGNFIKIIFLVYAIIINASWNVLMYALSPLWIEIGKILKVIFNIIIRNQMASF